MVTETKPKRKAIIVHSGKCPVCGCDSDAWREVFDEPHICFEPENKETKDD
jgi:hypothetical protein